MKTANLSVAIIYSMFYLYILVTSIGKQDWTVMWGLLFVFPPVLMTWLNWHEAKRKDKSKE